MHIKVNILGSRDGMFCDSYPALIPVNLISIVLPFDTVEHEVGAKIFFRTTLGGTDFLNVMESVDEVTSLVTGHA